MSIIQQSGTEEPGSRPPRRSGRWGVLFLVLAVLLWPSVSYVQALTYPGQAGFLDRTVEWIRDNGGSGLVDVLENWWFSSAPATARPDQTSLPQPPRGPVIPPAAAPAALPTLAGAAWVEGEGVWRPGPATPTGTPALYTTFVRPDPQHPSVVAGVARMDSAVLRFRSVAGTAQPVLDPTQAARVPGDMLPTLVATFNSGFKMADAQGGVQIGGRTIMALRSGAASLVISLDGSATVGQWGRDVGPGPTVASVRQNLDLIVDRGLPVPGLATNTDGRWGSAKNQLQYTWRSAIGVDATGALVYVGGNHLNLASLGAALVQARVVRGMELDIHTNKIDFSTYTHSAAGVLDSAKLLPDIPGPADRYLRPDLRDFFVASLR